MARHVLFVEDDEVIREATRLALERVGFRVSVAADGVSGLRVYQDERPDVVLLDVMLPELNGVSLCRRIRDVDAVPILMVSARDDAVDVVLALEAGADDYVIKPFDTTVLVARIHAVLRRAKPVDAGAVPPGGRLRFGDVDIDPDAVEVLRAGEAVELTPTEMRLLLRFAEAPGRVLSRDTLLAGVWDYPAGGDTRVVDIHVQRLRVKIGQDRIQTVRGFGYKLRADP